MPWVVKKNGGKYCVYKQDGDSPISGGCHANRADATRQMRALYANTKKYSESVVMDRLSMLVPLQFSEKDIEDGKLRKWVQALPYGSWDHPLYGMSYFSEWNAENMVRNFKENVHGKELLTTDYEHGLDPARGTMSSGTILDMEAKTDGLFWFVEFTPRATKEILDGEWNYFSPEYHDIWENPMDNVIHSDVAQGGGLTNKPWVRGMLPINLSEVLAERGAIVVDPQGEVSWEEHHDPDQDPHSQPKPEDDDSAADTGSRRDTPPIETEEQEASMKLSAAVLTALGLSEDATEEQINEALEGASTELVEFREAKAEADKQDEEAKAFSERYPEQAARLTEQDAELLRLKKKDAERDAVSFGKRFSEFVIKVPGEKDDAGNETEVEVRKGFSSLVCEQLTDLHKKFSEGTATADDLTPILEKIVSGNGIVEYGERGTSEDSTKDDEGAANPQEAAKKLSELALAAVKASEGTDKPITYGDALSDVMKANPELSKTYTGKEG